MLQASSKRQQIVDHLWQPRWLGDGERIPPTCSKFSRDAIAERVPSKIGAVGEAFAGLTLSRT